MTTEMVMAPEGAVEQFTREWGMLLTAGVSLQATLGILAVESPPPLAEVAAQLGQLAEKPQEMRGALEEYPALFSPAYLAMVHVGVISGRLDHSMNALATYLREMRELKTYTKSTLFEQAQQTSQPPEEGMDWDRTSRDDRYLLLWRFCRTFGMLLHNGVPILQAMEVASNLLPPTPQWAVLVARLGILHERKWLEEALPTSDFPPPLVSTLIHIGERNGKLDETMLAAAEIYRQRLLA